MGMKDNVNVEVEVLAVHLLRLLLPPTQLRKLFFLTSIRSSTDDSSLAPVLLALLRPLRDLVKPLLPLPLTVQPLIQLPCLSLFRSPLLASLSLVVLPLFFKVELAVHCLKG